MNHGTILECLSAVSSLLLGAFPVHIRREVAISGAHRKRRLLKDLISEFSTGLLSTEPDRLDATIKQWLLNVLELVDANRMCWYVRHPGSAKLECVYSVSKPGSPRSPAVVDAEQIPHTFRCLMQQNATLHIPNELPPEAARDRQFYAENLMGSLVLIPSNCGTDEKGILGLASAASDVCWNSETLRLLRLLNNLIVTANQRKICYELHQESERRFQCLFREAPIGLALEDLEGGLLFVNPALCSILGYTETELIGMRCAEFSHPADLKDEALLFEKLLAGSIENYRCEKRFVRKDGTQVWGRVHVSLLKPRVNGRVFVVGMLEDITTENRATQELLKTHMELQHVAQRLIQVQDDERQRISRELHDDIGQRISLLALELEVFGNSLAGLGRVAESRQAAELQSQANVIARDVQQLSHELHSAKLHHLGLVAALRELCRQASKRIPVTAEIEATDSLKSLSADVELCLFRVAQEAVNNAVRHSEAQQVSVCLGIVDGLVRLRVKDTGVGFDTSGSFAGIGMVSMRERMRMTGGDLVVVSSPGKGTELTAEIRLPMLDIPSAT